MWLPPTRLPPPMPVPGLTPTLLQRILGAPRWTWFIVVMVAVPIASVPAMGLARYTTSSSSYCLSCHATGETPDRSIRSLVHPDFNQVTCVDCHARPGQIVFEGYVKGFLAEPERVNENCTRCHRPMLSTNQQSGFKFNFLNVRITHEDHLARGATCTTCHFNVAHDPGVPATNRPAMQACYTCHAVNDSCAKCHTQGPPAGAAPVPAPAAAGLLGDGRVYYMRTCSACHGGNGDQLRDFNLHSAEFLNGMSDATLVQVIAEGKGVMPGFGGAVGGPLAPDQIKAVIGYLRSAVVGKANPDPQALYYQNCVVCHGDDGDKVAGARHNDPAFWNRAQPAEIFRAVERGKGGMPAFGKAEGGPLTNPEIQAVLDFLRSKATPPPVAAQPAASAANEEGRALFEKNCAACHGKAGNQLASADLSSADFLASRGDALFASTAEGKGGMPAFGKAKGGTLTDAEIRAMLDFLRAQANPVATTPAPAAAPAPNGEGRALYEKNCALCHGSTGNQLPGADLSAADFLAGRGDDALFAATTQGKGGMPALGQAKGGTLTDDQVRAIIQYLKTK